MTTELTYKALPNGTEAEYRKHKQHNNIIDKKKKKKKIEDIIS
jgi:hypothetical protein